MSSCDRLGCPALVSDAAWAPKKVFRRPSRTHRWRQKPRFATYMGYSIAEALQLVFRAVWRAFLRSSESRLASRNRRVFISFSVYSSRLYSLEQSATAHYSNEESPPLLTHASACQSCQQSSRPCFAAITGSMDIIQQEMAQCTKKRPVANVCCPNTKVHADELNSEREVP